MDSSADCMTEVFSPASSFDDRVTRLHLFLRSSSYHFGAIYTPVKKAESQSPAPPTKGEDGATSASDETPFAILLLKGSFPWRFGGISEQVTSPPWTWGSEQLCGNPNTYFARDLTPIDPIAPPHREPLCSAAYIIRLCFCSTTAQQYLKTTQIHEFPGWLSEHWFTSNNPQQTPFVPGALQYVCIQSFDTTASLERAAALLLQSLQLMEVHKPFLQWNVGTYQLEASLAHSKVSEDASLSRVNWEYRAYGAQADKPTHRPPANSLVYRKRKLSP